MATETGDGASQWLQSEVVDLIGIGGDSCVQAKLKGCYRNPGVFDSNAKEMAERGLSHSWLQ